MDFWIFMFWVFMLIFCLLIPCVMIIFGKRFRSNPPKNINSLYGYRTTMSMKNMDTWLFAHTYCGTLWQKCGTVLLPCSLLAMLPFIRQSIPVIAAASTLLCIVQCILMVVTLIPVERALKRTFDKSGRRKPISS